MSSKEEIDSVTRLTDAQTFALWEFEIGILFEAKNLKGIVSGETKMPEEDQKAIAQWKTQDALAKHIILRTIDSSVKAHVLTLKTASEMFASISKICLEIFYRAIFDDKGVKFIHGKVIYDEDDVVLVGEKQRNGLYTVDLGTDEEAMITQKTKSN
ncbi:hypothetical protein ONE63_007130 [Megalurothrips usitatus]|uniref:Uncharacterized protein n=1 Tax=Megalurothrips usitatus TaxID=439358 RepID=A0AAV7XR17_9NEOP|nr:hypothetical protein ONE63_007130 [Megalurothrips usitatus]